MSRFRWLTVSVAVAIAASGCEIGGDSPLKDGGGGMGGLSIEWNGQPSVLPTEPSSDRTIERVVFLLDNLSVVGEAGSFDLEDPRLEWSRGVVPAPVQVTGAPPGLYSRLLFELDGDSDAPVEYAYEIIGTVRVDDVFEPYTIRDTTDVNLSFDFSITVVPGEMAKIPVRVDLYKIVNAVDFRSVSKTDGQYLVDKSSTQATAVRTAAHDAFSISGPS